MRRTDIFRNIPINNQSYIKIRVCKDWIINIFTAELN